MFTDQFFNRNPGSIQLLKNFSFFNDLFEPKTISGNNELSDSFLKIEYEYQAKDDAYHFNLLHNHLCNFLMTAERHSSFSVDPKIQHSPDFSYLLRFKDLLEKNFAQKK